MTRTGVHALRRSTPFRLPCTLASTACLLAAQRNIRSYCIVDLPEMLAYAAIGIGRYAPGLEVVFHDEALEAVRMRRPGVAALLLPDLAPRLPRRTFDSVVNFNSFME